MNLVSAPPMPWHAHPWEQCMAQLEQDRLPHALLIQGLPGLGKQSFARQLAQALLCRAADGPRPCEHCKSCQLFDSQNHPDYLQLEPEGAGNAIKIEQIRRLNQFLAQTAQQGGRQCVVINQAERMNTNATNALLKSLEEPQGEAVLVLVTAYPSRLLATVRSRCQTRVLTPPSRADALEWLEPQVGERAGELLSQAHGAPLAALRAFRDDLDSQERELLAAVVALLRGDEPVSQAARRLQDSDSLQLADFMLDWLDHLVAKALAGRPLPERLAALEAPTAHVAPDRLCRFYDNLLKVKQALLSPANLNAALVWEEVLMDWQALVRARPARPAIVAGRGQ